MANNQWPPAPYDIAAAKFREWDAWYRGDTKTLNEIYNGMGETTHFRKGTPHTGGVIGTLSKMWWGRPVAQGENRSAVHDPLAGGICQLSADLLFSEAPKVRFVEPEDLPKDGKKPSGEKWVHPGQARLDEIMASDETHAELLKAAEYAAALGGVYMTVVWDKDISDKVWLKAYRADCVIPQFHYGKLIGANLWTEYRKDQNVYRFLEAHRPGMISYELFQGGEKNLGNPVPLSMLEETLKYESFRVPAELEDPENVPLAVTVATGIDKLAVVYWPNMLPNPEWEKLGVLANLGRSDLAGLEDLLDKFDLVASSLIRDVDNGQGRVIIPETYLHLAKPGEPGYFDMNRQIYSPINILGQSDVAMKPEVVQFDIRVEDHERTADFLLRRIAFKTGYSEAHLKIIAAGSGLKTATEIEADFRDSARTRDKKTKYVKPALAQLAQVALAIDGVVFPGKGGGLYPETPVVDFPDLTQQDMEKVARTVQIAHAAEAMSLRERVIQLHPDWTNDQIDDEVDAIRLEGQVLDPAAGSDVYSYTMSDREGNVLPNGSMQEKEIQGQDRGAAGAGNDSAERQNVSGKN